MTAVNQITREQMRARLVRYGELIPCRTAFIDTRTPGSEAKENFTIIGPGVAENPDQHVHIREPHGFNIGAARQPPGCVNSQHSHETAEVFWIHSGRWRFMTGEHGEDGEVVLERGDTISIPIHVFRGFENIGSGEGFMFAALGGDDPGRVTWAPYVFDDARKYGLVLLENGRLIDTQAGESVPAGEPVMPRTTPRQVKSLDRLDSAALESCVARYSAANGSNGADRSILAENAGGGQVREKAVIGQDNPQEGVPASAACLEARLSSAAPRLRSGRLLAAPFAPRRGSVDDSPRHAADRLGRRLHGPRPRRCAHRSHRPRTQDRESGPPSPQRLSWSAAATRPQPRIGRARVEKPDEAGQAALFLRWLVGVRRSISAR